MQGTASLSETQSRVSVSFELANRVSIPLTRACVAASIPGIPIGRHAGGSWPPHRFGPGVAAPCEIAHLGDVVATDAWQAVKHGCFRG